MGLNTSAAVNRAEWRQSQPLEVTAPGLIKVALPAETLGALRPEAADLRLLDPAGAEVGWFLERPLRFAPEALVRRTKSFQVTLKPRATVLLLETGTTLPVAGLALEGGSGPFLKAARNGVRGLAPDGRGDGDAAGRRLEHGAVLRVRRHERHLSSRRGALGSRVCVSERGGGRGGGGRVGERALCARLDRGHELAEGRGPRTGAGVVRGDVGASI